MSGLIPQSFEPHHQKVPPLTHPFASIPEDVVAACCVDVVRAIADRPYLDTEGQTTRAQQTVALIASLGARTPRHLVQAGQSVLLHTVAAEAGREILRGLSGAQGLRAQGNIIAMNRLIITHLSALTDPAPASPAWSMPPPDFGPEPEADPTEEPQSSPPEPEPSQQATAEAEEADETDPARIRRVWAPDPEGSWLDEPTQTWVQETPAMAQPWAGQAPPPPAADSPRGPAGERASAREPGSPPETSPPSGPEPANLALIPT